MHAMKATITTMNNSNNTSRIPSTFRLADHNSSSSLSSSSSASHSYSYSHSSSAAQQLPTYRSGRNLLPMDFVPTDDSVICGRGKACSKAHGNSKLKEIVQGFLVQYSSARSKVEKTAIVSSIVSVVRGNQQERPDAAFVKFENGRWWSVEESTAREKVGCILRDCLHTRYRSSTKSKLAKRRARKAMHSMTPPYMPFASSSAGAGSMMYSSHSQNKNVSDIHNFSVHHNNSIVGAYTNGSSYHSNSSFNDGKSSYKNDPNNNNDLGNCDHTGMFHSDMTRNNNPQQRPLLHQSSNTFIPKENFMHRNDVYTPEQQLSKNNNYLANNGKSTTPSTNWLEALQQHPLSSFSVRSSSQIPAPSNNIMLPSITMPSAPISPEQSKRSLDIIPPMMIGSLPICTGDTIGSLQRDADLPDDISDIFDD